jgi:hypothetical protein
MIASAGRPNSWSFAAMRQSLPVRGEISKTSYMPKLYHLLEKVKVD